MAESIPIYTFISKVLVEKGKNGRSAHVTIPPALRDALGFRGGELLELRIQQIIVPETKKK